MPEADADAQLASKAMSRGTYVAVGLLSLSLMSTEIVLTRVFSVVLWYHFAFFAISIAMLGLGAGAVAVYALRDRALLAKVPIVLASTSLLVGLATLCLSIGLLRMTPDWFGTGLSVFFTNITWKLLLVFALTAAPFALGGFALSLAFSRYASVIHKLYGWDLLGAGLGCALCVPLLDRLGGPEALVACACLSAAAAPCFMLAEPSRSRRGFSAGGALLVLVLGLCAHGLGWLEIRVAKGLDLVANRPELQRWNSFSLVSVFPTWDFRGWGLSPAFSEPVPPPKGLVIDMNAFTPLVAFDGDFAKVAHTRSDLSAFAFRVAAPAGRACIIGAGGGKDVLAALASGSSHVTAVEVNPLIVDDVMRGPYRAFTGGLYERPDVSVHVGDGRSFVRGSPARYAVILISMVDTSAATAAGAFALAENALYTTDAFADFLSRLTPGGMLTVSSVSFEGLAVGARLASIARAALERRGHDPAASVAVLETQWLGVPGATMFNFVIKPAGFDAEERARIAAEASALRFGLTYLAGASSASSAPTASAAGGSVSGPERALIRKILLERDSEALERALSVLPLDVTAVGDDRPFFFYQNRLRDAASALFEKGTTHLFGNGLLILIKVLVAAVLMLCLLIAVPLWLTRREVARGSARTTARLGVDLTYVACVGLGFMCLEIGLIQRLLTFLGQPTYTLTAVLFVLLVGGGLGSRFSARLDTRGVHLVLLALCGYALGFVLLWETLALAALGLPAALRALLVAVVLAPLGALLGVPLPSALSRVQARNAERIPWLWGVNSAASVLGSVLATIVSMNRGISASMLAGVFLYACARVLFPRLARS